MRNNLPSTASLRLSEERGFTLIELLVVITIISVLAVVVFVALNPAKRLSDARDARRTQDVQSLLTAIHQYDVDSKGQWPTGLTQGVEVQLGTSTTGCAIATNGCNVVSAQDACVDLTTDLVKYFKSIPVDPLNDCTANPADCKTGYSVLRDTNNIITVRACRAEGGVGIYSSR